MVGVLYWKQEKSTPHVFREPTYLEIGGRQGAKRGKEQGADVGSHHCKRFTWAGEIVIFQPPVS